MRESGHNCWVLIGLKWREGRKDNRHMVRFDRFGDSPDSIGIMDPLSIEYGYCEVSNL